MKDISARISSMIERYIIYDILSVLPNGYHKCMTNVWITFAANATLDGRITSCGSACKAGITCVNIIYSAVHIAWQQHINSRIYIMRYNKALLRCRYRLFSLISSIEGKKIPEHYYTKRMSFRYSCYYYIYTYKCI